MQIVCPNCAARYLTPDDAIGPNGRRVRCARCSTVWRAEPPAPSSAADPDIDPVLPPEPAPDRTVRVSPLPRDRTPVTAADAARRNRPSVVGWGLFFGLLIVLIAGFFFGREQVQQAWPASSVLYEAVGLEGDPTAPPAEPPRPKLEVSGLQNAWIDGDKGLQLVLKGQVTNTGENPAKPPLVRIRLYDKTGAIVRDKREQVRGGDLKPGESRNFAMSFQDPGDVARALPALEPQ